MRQRPSLIITVIGLLMFFGFCAYGAIEGYW